MYIDEVERRTLRIENPMQQVIIFALTLVLLPTAVSAQVAQPTPPDSLVKVELTDGSSFVGTITASSAESITLHTTGGADVTIPRGNITKTVPAPGQVVEGKYQRPDPNYSRLLFIPTARALEPGAGYFADYWLFFSFLGVGVGNGFTAAGGISLFPGADNQIFYLAPKWTFYRENDRSLAVGVLHFGLTGETLDRAPGIAYVVGTVGTSHRALSVGLGYGYLGEDFANDPMLVVGGEFQTSDYLKLLGELWIPPATSTKLMLAGVRVFGEHVSGDFGFMYAAFSSESSDFPVIPWLGLAYNFGN